MKRPYAVHPFLVGAFPVLSLFSHNAGQVSFTTPLPSLAIILGVTFLAVLSLRVVLKNTHKTASIVSLLLISFFSYGHIYSQGWLLGSFLRHRHFLLAGTIVIAGLVYLILRSRSDFRNTTRILNVIAVSLCIIPLMNTGVYLSKTNSYSRFNQEKIAGTPRPKEEKPGTLPDIYYIILDGYGRTDVLREMYGYDNMELETYLKNKGFFISSTSRANYCQTTLSLASSLNFSYIENLIEEIDLESDDRRPLMHLINDNRVIHFLKQNGYQTVAFSSGYSLTDMRSADLYLTENTGFIDEFQNELINMTPLALLNDFQIGAYFQSELHRNRILYTLDNLPHIPETGAPAFVFAHVILPHPPFVFDRYGGRVNPKGKFSIKDGTHFSEARRRNGYSGNHKEAYITGYRDQVMFTAKKIQSSIDGILSSVPAPPIIILQSDHGPGASLDWEDPEKTRLKERLSILNAYYFPGQDYSLLYNGISPVNTFRAVFNTYFHTDLEFLSDRSYFSTWTHPYRFIRTEEKSE